MALIENKTYVTNEVDYKKLAKTISENSRTEIDYDKLADCIADALQRNENTEDPESRSAVYTLLQLFSFSFLAVFGIASLACCAIFSYTIGISYLSFEETITMYSVVVFLGILAIFSFIAAYEVEKTKKFDFLNIVFTAIMSFSSLIVAIVSAVFAYRSIH